MSFVLGSRLVSRVSVHHFHGKAKLDCRHRASSNPRILLLQGPVGPFFKHLRKAFDNSGYDAWHVRFNAADRFYGSREKALNYGGSLESFESWLEEVIKTGKFDAVVLFGSSRPIHATARLLCTRLSIPVICLEEGYVRPGFVTIEEGGNNAFSPISGLLPSPESKVDLPVSVAKAGSSFGRMAFHGARYFALHGMFSTRSERRMFHKPDRARLVPEALCWIRNFVRKSNGLRRNSQLFQTLLEHHRKSYFVVALQVSDDSQLMSDAGRGWTNEMLVLRVMKSFAKHGNEHHRLVFKVHPLERGHIDVKSLISKPAELMGIADRVDIIDDVSMGLLIREAAGLVTVNSSSGFSAIFHGTPVAVTGDAIFGHRDLVTLAERQADLDAFWSNPRTAPAEVRSRYLSWMRYKALAPGDFYLESEIGQTADAVIDKCARAIQSASLGKVVALPSRAMSGDRRHG